MGQKRPGLFLVYRTIAEIRSKFDHFGPQKGRWARNGSSRNLLQEKQNAMKSKAVQGKYGHKHSSACPGVPPHPQHRCLHRPSGKVWRMLGGPWRVLGGFWEVEKSRKWAKPNRHALGGPWEAPGRFLGSCWGRSKQPKNQENGPRLQASPEPKIQESRRSQGGPGGQGALNPKS